MIIFCDEIIAYVHYSINRINNIDCIIISYAYHFIANYLHM